MDIFEELHLREQAARKSAAMAFSAGICGGMLIMAAIVGLKVLVMSTAGVGTGQQTEPPIQNTFSGLHGLDCAGLIQASMDIFISAGEHTGGRLSATTRDRLDMIELDLRAHGCIGPRTVDDSAGNQLDEKGFDPIPMPSADALEK